MMQKIILEAGTLEAVLAPGKGGSIARFDRHASNGRQPILRGADAPSGPLDAACFPLVPFANRIRAGRFSFRGRSVEIAPNMTGDPSPLHGFGWLAPWEVAHQTATSATLIHVHAPGEWPWAYEAVQRFTLDDAGLTVGLACRNLSASAMPCGLGFHPYFPCGADTRITTGVARVWTVDDQVLPIAAEPAIGRYALDDAPLCARDLDNGYDGWSGSARLHYPDRDADTRMSSPTARFFQLYSPVDGGYVAAEPVGHRNAALNEDESRWDEAGLVILGPNEECSLEMRIEIVTTGGA